MRAAGTALVALVVLISALPAREPAKDDLLEIEKKLRAVTETAGPSVACVVVSRSDRYPKVASSGDQPGKLGGYDRTEFLKANPTEDRLARTLDLSQPNNIPDYGCACGVVIDSTGLILTPYHVVDGATKIYVYLPGRPGSYADIHAADARYDLAVLKLNTAPSNNLTPIKFADVHLATADGGHPLNGKLVVLMANVYVAGAALDKPSSALGSITNVRTTLGLGVGEGTLKSSSYYYFGPFLEHDAKLNAGVSGAALLNLDGEMIGLTTTAAAIGGGERAPNYAFPADDNFRRVVDVLRRGEEVNYGYLGVKLNSDDRLPPGAQQIRLLEVVPHGPASKAGLDNGDTITHINGIRVKTYDELLFHIGTALAGSKVKLTTTRRGEVTVVLGKLKNTQPVIASVRPDPVFGLRVDYGSLLAQPEAPSGGVPAGVCVSTLVPNSPAAAAFKKLGDTSQKLLITRINGTAVSTPAEFYKAAKGQQSVKLIVIDPSEPRKEREVSFP